MARESSTTEAAPARHGDARNRIQTPSVAIQRVATATAFLSTAVLSALIVLSFLRFAGPPGLTLVVWLSGFAMWGVIGLAWRAYVVGLRAESLRKSILPATAETTRDIASLVAAETPPSAGHWWTQDALRDEARKIRIGGRDSDGPPS